MYYAIPEGSNYAVYSSNGTRVSTTSVAGLMAFGLSTSNLGSKPATTATPTQTTATPTQTTAPTSSNNVNAGRTQVTLGNGQTVWYDSAGQAYDASGNKLSNTTVSASVTPSQNTASTTSSIPPGSGSPVQFTNGITLYQSGGYYYGANGVRVPSLPNDALDFGSVDANGNVTIKNPAISASQTQSGPITSISQLTRIGTTSDGYPEYQIPAGYNLGSNFAIGGTTYQVNDNVIIPNPQLANASQWGIPDISTYAITPAQTTNNTATSSNTNTLSYNPAWSTYGLTQDSWNSMNSTQQAVVSAALTVASNNYSTGASKISLSDALAAAATDPNLIAKYADAAAIDKNAFQNTITQLQQDTSTNSQQQQQQFENDRKALAEQQGAAGTAYSGFRGQAQEQLGNTESGIIQSTRSQLQNNLNQATQGFEAKYGTSATTPASIQYNDPSLNSNYTLSGLYSPSGGSLNTLSGSTIGGITGSQPIAKQNDINSTAAGYVQAGEIPVPTSI